MKSLPKLKSVKVSNKKKILLLSDDLRMSSGVGTMSREIVFGTLDKYDWYQVGGAIKHPEKGKLIDMNDVVRKETGIEDANLKVLPIDGYGNQELIRDLIRTEKPDAIMIYTDPRFWIWLFEMEHEVRQNIPIFYYNIWDDWPAPKYNQNYYESCDLIMNISKQTCAIVNDVCDNKPRTDWDSTYIPHGINEKHFYPVENEDEKKEMEQMKKQLFKGKDIDFCLFYNNRNIRRKMTSDTIMAFREFAYRLPKEQRDKVAFVLHTQPIDPNGTDLPEVVKAMCPDLNIIFSTEKLDNKHLNYLYNICDVTINLASNEGFGLGTCESLMCGTPIIVNVTGGLQDQCGFMTNRSSENEVPEWDYLTDTDYKEIKSLHDWRKYENNENFKHGEWVKPVWPRTRSLQGSVPTPYIMDDRCDWVDASHSIEYFYNLSKEERDRVGRLGHEFVTSDEAMMSARHMCENFIDHMETAFEKWTPRKRVNTYKV